MLINGEEIYIIDDSLTQERCLLYIPTRRCIIPISTETKHKILRRDEECIDELLKKVQSMEKVNIDAEMLKQKNSLPGLAINLTDNCTLMCLYCYACSRQHDKSADMSEEEAIEIIDMFINYSINVLNKKCLWFSFFGGAEPLYNQKTFVNLVEYIKRQSVEKGFKCRLGLTTNGYYEEDIMKYIIENFYSITLSIDGPEKIQNCQRPACGNKDSFEVVFRNAKLLYDSKVDFHFRATISGNMMDEWKSVIDFFYENFEGCKLMLEPYLLIGRGKAANCKLIPVSTEQWINVAPEIYNYAKNKIKLKFKGVGTPDTFNLYYCGAATGKQWIVSKGKTVCTCAHERTTPYYNLGKLDDVLSDNKAFCEKISEIQTENAVINIDMCKDCFCKYTCAGGCTSIRREKENFCAVTKAVTQLVFSEYVQEKLNIN